MESSFSRKLPEKCQIKTLYFFLSGDYLGYHIFAPKLATWIDFPYTRKLSIEP